MINTMPGAPSHGDLGGSSGHDVAVVGANCLLAQADDDLDEDFGETTESFHHQHYVDAAYGYGARRRRRTAVERKPNRTESTRSLLQESKRRSEMHERKAENKAMRDQAKQRLQVRLRSLYDTYLTRVAILLKDIQKKRNRYHAETTTILKPSRPAPTQLIKNAAEVVVGASSFHRVGTSTTTSQKKGIDRRTQEKLLRKLDYEAGKKHNESRERSAAEIERIVERGLSKSLYRYCGTGSGCGDELPARRSGGNNVAQDHEEGAHRREDHLHELQQHCSTELDHDPLVDQEEQDEDVLSASAEQEAQGQAKAAPINRQDDEKNQNEQARLSRGEHKYHLDQPAERRWQHPRFAPAGQKLVQACNIFRRFLYLKAELEHKKEVEEHVAPYSSEEFILGKNKSCSFNISATTRYYGDDVEPCTNKRTSSSGTWTSIGRVQEEQVGKKRAPHLDDGTRKRNHGDVVARALHQFWNNSLTLSDQAALLSVCDHVATTHQNASAGTERKCRSTGARRRSRSGAKRNGTRRPARGAGLAFVHPDDEDDYTASSEAEFSSEVRPAGDDFRRAGGEIGRIASGSTTRKRNSSGAGITSRKQKDFDPQPLPQPRNLERLIRCYLRSCVTTATAELDALRSSFCQVESNYRAGLQRQVDRDKEQQALRKKRQQYKREVETKREAVQHLQGYNRNLSKVPEDGNYNPDGRRNDPDPFLHDADGRRVMFAAASSAVSRHKGAAARGTNNSDEDDDRAGYGEDADSLALDSELDISPQGNTDLASDALGGRLGCEPVLHGQQTVAQQLGAVEEKSTPATICPGAAGGTQAGEGGKFPKEQSATIRRRDEALKNFYNQDFTKMTSADRSEKLFTLSAQRQKAARQDVEKHKRFLEQMKKRRSTMKKTKDREALDKEIRKVTLKINGGDLLEIEDLRQGENWTDLLQGHMSALQDHKLEQEWHKNYMLDAQNVLRVHSGYREHHLLREQMRGEIMGRKLQVVRHAASSGGLAKAMAMVMPQPPPRDPYWRLIPKPDPRNLQRGSCTEFEYVPWNFRSTRELHVIRACPITTLSLMRHREEQEREKHIQSQLRFERMTRQAVAPGGRRGHPPEGAKWDDHDQEEHLCQQLQSSRGHHVKNLQEWQLAESAARHSFYGKDHRSQHPGAGTTNSSTKRWGAAGAGGVHLLQRGENQHHQPAARHPLLFQYNLMVDEPPPNPPELQLLLEEDGSEDEELLNEEEDDEARTYRAMNERREEQEEKEAKEEEEQTESSTDSDDVGPRSWWQRRGKHKVGPDDGDGAAGADAFGSQKIISSKNLHTKHDKNDTGNKNATTNNDFESVTSLTTDSSWSWSPSEDDDSRWGGKNTRRPARRFTSIDVQSSSSTSSGTTREDEQKCNVEVVASRAGSTPVRAKIRGGTTTTNITQHCPTNTSAALAQNSSCGSAELQDEERASLEAVAVDGAAGAGPEVAGAVSSIYFRSSKTSTTSRREDEDFCAVGEQELQEMTTAVERTLACNDEAETSLPPAAAAEQRQPQSFLMSAPGMLFEEKHKDITTSSSSERHEQKMIPAEQQDEHELQKGQQQGLSDCSTSLLDAALFNTDPPILMKMPRPAANFPVAAENGRDLVAEAEPGGPAGALFPVGAEDDRHQVDFVADEQELAVSGCPALLSTSPFLQLQELPPPPATPAAAAVEVVIKPGANEPHDCTSYTTQARRRTSTTAPAGPGEQAAHEDGPQSFDPVVVVSPARYAANLLLERNSNSHGFAPAPGPAALAPPDDVGGGVAVLSGRLTGKDDVNFVRVGHGSGHTGQPSFETNSNGLKNTDSSAGTIGSPSLNEVLVAPPPSTSFVDYTDLLPLVADQRSERKKLRMKFRLLDCSAIATNRMELLRAGDDAQEVDAVAALQVAASSSARTAAASKRDQKLFSASSNSIYVRQLRARIRKELRLRRRQLLAQQKNHVYAARRGNESAKIDSSSSSFTAEEVEQHERPTVVVPLLRNFFQAARELYELEQVELLSRKRPTSAILPCLFQLGTVLRGELLRACQPFACHRTTLLVITQAFRDLNRVFLFSAMSASPQEGPTTINVAKTGKIIVGDADDSAGGTSSLPPVFQAKYLSIPPAPEVRLHQILRKRLAGNSSSTLGMLRHLCDRLARIPMRDLPQTQQRGGGEQSVAAPGDDQDVDAEAEDPVLSSSSKENDAAAAVKSQKAIKGNLAREAVRRARHACFRHAVSAQETRQATVIFASPTRPPVVADQWRGVEVVAERGGSCHKQKAVLPARQSGTRSCLSPRDVGAEEQSAPWFNVVVGGGGITRSATSCIN
ncbi:unnamed protein product [Amoebophrya sp. A120]|nr:unnamed protein product [Amoebophrya sp. A120]|eukprot:GSA120T00005988001.1